MPKELCEVSVYASSLLPSTIVHQALIWDIQQMPRAIEDPILAYTAAEGEINQIQVDTAWLSSSWPAPSHAHH